MKKILALALFALIGTADVVSANDSGWFTRKPKAKTFKTARFNNKPRVVKHVSNNYGKYMALTTTMALATAIVGYLNSDEKQRAEQGYWLPLFLLKNGASVMANGLGNIPSVVSSLWDKYGYGAAEKAAQALAKAQENDAIAKAGQEYDNLYRLDVIKLWNSRDSYIAKNAAKFMAK